MSSWFEVTIDVPNDLAEAVASVLFDLGCPGLECRDRDGVTSLVTYFREVPRLDALLSVCADAGLLQPVIRTRRIREENWAQDWKRHFQPLMIGERLLISPPWNLPTATDRTLIVVEPAMAFGTGQHATTRGCLELVEEAVTVGNVCRALDVGTGSGILALALAKLGVEHVCAIDTDAVACRAAAANIKRNGVKSVRITDDWQDVAETFDLIVANLFTNLLRDLAEELSCRLAKNASLICSGFLASDEAVVVAAYPDFQVIRRRDRDAWVALMLRRLDSLS